MAVIPTHDQLLNPTLEALRKLGGSASITELLEQVIEDLQPPKEIVESPHPGKTNQTDEQLIDKLKDLKLGVATRQVEVVEVNTEWFSAI